MICLPCQCARHRDCADIPRQKDADAGLIPSVHPNVSMWCYCQHGKRDEPVPPDPPQPAGD